ncbi:MAG: MFS transporter [Pseudomonadota bacterium]
MRFLKPLLRDWHGVLDQGWRSPQILLLLFAASLPLAFEAWAVLLNNFSIEQADFTGREIGILQSLREVPGFLAFTVVFMLLIWKQQTFAVLSLAVMGLGVALTGFFPTVWGLYFTTVIMSTGFHYLATMEQALAMQWTESKELPVVLGRMAAAASFASLVTFGLVYVALSVFDMAFVWVYFIAGVAVMGVAVFAWFAFPHFKTSSYQNMSIVLRKRYWLYYALEFMSGARRQIFMVFAAFMMVEKFHYDAEMITLLFLVNCLISIWIAPKVGNLIKRWGERPALVLEYVGLIGVFTAYAFVEVGWMAAGLYIIDHLFFALAIAIKSYFRKIADPAEIASTAGVSFTINHIAAVGLPAALGFVWLYNPSVVFLIGAGLAAGSLALSLLIPRDPDWGNETTVWRSRTVPSAAE